MTPKVATPKPPEPQENSETCKHDWQYNTDNKEYECSKCHIPAPENWNEVDF